MLINLDKSRNKIKNAYIFSSKGSENIWPFISKLHVHLKIT